MGTRSWTRFFRRYPPIPKNLVGPDAHHHIKHLPDLPRQLVGIVYRQFDGYPEVVGRDVVEFVTAIQTESAGKPLTAEEYFDRYLERLATKEVVHFKVEIPKEGLTVIDMNACSIMIEWVYDLEVTDVTGDVTMSVIPGAGGTDICMAEKGKPEGIVARGTVEEIGQWIEAGPYEFD